MKATVIDSKTARTETGTTLVILGITCKNVSFTIWDTNGPEKIKKICLPGQEMEIDHQTPKGLILKFQHI